MNNINEIQANEPTTLDAKAKGTRWKRKAVPCKTGVLVLEDHMGLIQSDQNGCHWSVDFNKIVAGERESMEQDAHSQAGCLTLFMLWLE